MKVSKSDCRLAAVVVLGFVLVIAGTALGSSVADYFGSPRQAHALHAVSFGLLQATGMGAVSLGVIAGVVALARALELRGGIRRRAGTLRTGSVVRMSPRSVKP